MKNWQTIKELARLALAEYISHFKKVDPPLPHRYCIVAGNYSTTLDFSNITPPGLQMSTEYHKEAFTMAGELDAEAVFWIVPPFVKGEVNLVVYMVPDKGNHLIVTGSKEHWLFEEPVDFDSLAAVQQSMFPANLSPPEKGD